MPPSPSSRLAAPFAPSSIGWHAVERGGDGGRARLAPHLRAEAVQARLDDVAGPDGWSLRLVPWGPDGLVAELTVLGATRAGVARLAPPVRDASLVADAAFAAAAERFGMRAPVVVADDGWVDADPESGEPLHVPETTAPPAAPDAPPAEPAAGAGPGAAATGSAPSGATGGDGAAAAATADGGTVDGAAVGEPADGATGGADDVPKPEAQRVIDRIVERLREEGLGAEAARLVTRYGGYGGDAARSRELYAKLRELLIERGGS